LTDTSLWAHTCIVYTCLCVFRTHGANSKPIRSNFLTDRGTWRSLCS